MTNPVPDASQAAAAHPRRVRCGTCECYNRCRRRLRARQMREAKRYEAVVATFKTNQWEGPSGPYMQQVMPGWRAGLPWPELVCCLAVLIVINGGLAGLSFVCWSRTAEIALDYTNCANATPAVCQLSLELNSNLTAPVYLYYALSNAYFNHRKIQTWSIPQLLGLPTKNLKKHCGQHAFRDGFAILPCGALPNAIFNDTFAILGPSGGHANDTELSSEGISWPSDTKGLYQPLPADHLSGTVQPASWPAPASRRYRRPFADAEDLHAWLRTPAFSSFRKIKHRLLLTGKLSDGNYRLVIGYNFPVSVFGGVKRLIIAQKSAFGGKNIALFLLPMAASSCYLLLCISALVDCHCRKPKREARLKLQSKTQ